MESNKKSGSNITMNIDRPPVTHLNYDFSIVDTPEKRIRLTVVSPKYEDMKYLRKSKHLCIYNLKSENEYYVLKVIFKNTFDNTFQQKTLPRFSSKCLLGIYSDNNTLPSIFFKNAINKFCSICRSDWEFLGIKNRFEEFDFKNILEEIDAYPRTYESVSTVICFHLSQSHTSNNKKFNFQNSTFSFVIIVSHDQSKKLTDSKTKMSISKLNKIDWQSKYEKYQVPKDSLLSPVVPIEQFGDSIRKLALTEKNDLYLEHTETQDCKSQSLEITEDEESIFTIKYPSSKIDDIVIKTIFINAELQYGFKVSNE